MAEKVTKIKNSKLRIKSQTRGDFIRGNLETSFAEIWRLHSGNFGDFIRANLETSFEQIWRLQKRNFGGFIREI